MKTIFTIKSNNIYILIFLSLILISCNSEVGLLSEKNKWLLDHINSVGDFFKVYFVLQISVFLVALISSFFLGKLGYIISLLIHFIWIISNRDYGFWKVLLLFFLFTILNFIWSTIQMKNKKNNIYDNYN